MTATTPFDRARSAEQRSARREAILRTAAEMLTRMRVAELSLNALAREVGLAKSNVLRYFESPGSGAARALRPGDQGVARRVGRPAVRSAGWTRYARLR